MEVTPWHPTQHRALWLNGPLTWDLLKVLLNETLWVWRWTLKVICCWLIVSCGGRFIRSAGLSRNNSSHALSLPPASSGNRLTSEQSCIMSVVVPSVSNRLSQFQTHHCACAPLAGVLQTTLRCGPAQRAESGRTGQCWAGLTGPKVLPANLLVSVDPCWSM